MKITKYEHACFTVENNDETLIVDPGCFTKELIIPDNVVGIIVTHAHEDHFDPNILAVIYDKNPESILISLSEITEKMPDHKSQSVLPGEKIEVGAFSLEFFGGKHAEVHSTIPIINNLGVLINETIYYPGDSFFVPNKSVELLALPASGPWFKFSEAVEFMNKIRPSAIFLTHDIHNSNQAIELYDRLFGNFASQIDVKYSRLGITESFD